MLLNCLNTIKIYSILFINVIKIFNILPFSLVATFVKICFKSKLYKFGSPLYNPTVIFKFDFQDFLKGVNLGVNTE